MLPELEQFVPRDQVIIYNDRLNASAPALFRIVHEFFSGWASLRRVMFWDNFCWLGFDPVQTGDEERGFIIIQSAWGVKNPADGEIVAVTDRKIDVGLVTIRALSPTSSRVSVQVNYSPEALSDLFKELTHFILMVVNGAAYADAWSRAFSEQSLRLAEPADDPAVPLLEAPQTEPKAVAAKASAGPTAEKSQTKAIIAKARKRRSKNKKTTQKRGKVKILLPKTKPAFLRWCQMWRIIQQTRLTYLDDPELNEKNPNPSLDELRDAIAEKMPRKPSQRTVSRVIQAAEAKLLK